MRRGVGRDTHLVADAAVRHVVARVDLADVHDGAEQVVGARAGELVVLLVGVLAAAAVGVGEHVELEREAHGRLDLGRFLVAALLVLEPLQMR